MNKQLLYKLLGILVIASFVLTACGGSSATQSDIANACKDVPAGNVVEIGEGTNKTDVTCDGSNWTPEAWLIAAVLADDTQQNYTLDSGYTVTRDEVLAWIEAHPVATATLAATLTPTPTRTPAATMTSEFTAVPTYTQTAVPTATATLTCLETLPKSVNSNTVTWTINGDIGDRTMHGISSWTNQDGVKMLAVTQHVFNVDVETASMQVHWIYTTTTSMNDVFCAADELARREGITQKFYIGLGDKPADYSTELLTAEGFAVKFTMFIGEEIDTAPAHWDTIPFSISASHVFSANEGEQMYGQMQSGSNRAQHFQIREGYQLSTPAFQGTRWVVTNWMTVLDNLLARFTQMTQEVVQRDDGVKIEAKVFCGSATETVPPGYQRAENVTGYTCTKLP